MMRLDTDPTTMVPRAGRVKAAGVPLLIQVPRVDEPREPVRFWRPARVSSRSIPIGRFRTTARPRRRLRRGVRRAVGSLLVLAAMAGTFALGWTTRGGGIPRLAVPRIAVLDRDAVGRAAALADGEGLSAQAPTSAEAEPGADAFATGPALDAPVADAEVPVIFRGYLLPDNSREEPAHEGS